MCTEGIDYRNDVHMQVQNAGVVAMCLDICQVINYKDYKSCVVAMCLGICQVINHKDYKSREEFDTALNDSLMAAGIEIVCLAGFMRILTGENLTR